MNLKSIILVGLVILCVLGHSMSAEAGNLYKEANFIVGYSDIDELVGEKGKMLKNSVGFEYYDKFSNDYGDYLTVNLQMRFSYDTSESFNDALAVEIHNAWLEYKLGLGKNLRFGHFDPAFGLEPVLDTHGTLFQTLAQKNIGFKKDWGIGYRGLLGDFDYEVAAQLGSGMSIERKDDSHLFTSRIGSAKDESFQYGLSLLYGRVLESKQARTIPKADFSDNAILKRRIGLDAQYDYGPYLFKGELAFGEDDDNEVIGTMFEADYTVPSLQNLQFQLQWQCWDGDLSGGHAIDSTLGIGASYKLNSTTTIRLAYFHDIDSFGAEKDRQVFLQVYFFGF